MANLKMKEVLFDSSAKRVGFYDILNDEITIADYKTIYQMFHNQSVVRVRPMSANAKMDILFEGMCSFHD